ncbi:Protein of unknown function [Gryllus bimaculatus]|nr:Protein of unknown function [Gryllus bimaculatus]
MRTHTISKANHVCHRKADNVGQECACPSFRFPFRNSTVGCAGVTINLAAAESLSEGRTQPPAPTQPPVRPPSDLSVRQRRDAAFAASGAERPPRDDGGLMLRTEVEDVEFISVRRKIPTAASRVIAGYLENGTKPVCAHKTRIPMKPVPCAK